MFIRIIYLIGFVYLFQACSSVRNIEFPRTKCSLIIDKDFNKEKFTGDDSDLFQFVNSSNEYVFINTKPELVVNVNNENYVDNDIWNDFAVADTIVLEGVHNGLYWKQIKFKKERYWPSIGYEGIPKEKVPEFEGYLKSFTCKKK